MPTPQEIDQVLLIGIVATALLDAWMLALVGRRQTSSAFMLIGRWVAYMARGRFAHVAIAKAAPLPGERPVGWLVHYATGIVYALLLAGILGFGWIEHPTLRPALCFGLVTAVVPLFVMQPAMGAGFASSRTTTPWKNRLRTLANHAVFGAGLYIAAALIETGKNKGLLQF